MEETWESSFVSDGSKVTIDLGDDSISMSAEGAVISNTGAKIGDIFSPVTESLGLLGDMIKARRQKNTLFAFEQIKKICDDRNLKLTPTPPKFFLEWIDGCSLEDADETVFNMWLELFVKAASEKFYSGNNLIFMRILREITQKEAELLMYIAPTFSSYEREPDWRLNADEYSYSGSELHKSAMFQFNPESYHWSTVADYSPEQMHSYLKDELVSNGYRASGVYLSTYGNDENVQKEDHGYHDPIILSAERDGTLSVLEALNLISRADLSHALENRKIEISAEAFYLMPVAFDFLRSCMGNDYPKKLIFKADGSKK